MTIIIIGEMDTPLTTHSTLLQVITAALALFAMDSSFAQDTDGDGVLDLVYNCLTVSNPLQIDQEIMGSVHSLHYCLSLWEKGSEYIFIGGNAL